MAEKYFLSQYLLITILCAKMSRVTRPRYVYFLHFLMFFFVGRRKSKLVQRDYEMGVLSCRNPKITGSGKKQVVEWFGLRTAGF